jgi:hypothetical protein
MEANQVKIWDSKYKQQKNFVWKILFVKKAEHSSYLDEIKDRQQRQVVSSSGFSPVDSSEFVSGPV